MILSNYTNLTQKTIKIILSNSSSEKYSSIDINFFESCLRLLKSLATQNMFSVEKCFQSGFINRLDEFLLNDICYQYVSIILEKISEYSYYKHHIYTNEKLVDRILRKFVENKNKLLVKYLLGVLVSLTEDEEKLSKDLSKRIYEMNFMELITSYIRFYENNIKILSTNLMVNVLSHISAEKLNESMVMWSVSILLNLLKEESAINCKIKIVRILSLICKKASEMQNVFYNLDGIDTMLKEMKALFSEEKIKEIDENVKNLKNSKTKKSERLFMCEKDDDNYGNSNLNNSMTDPTTSSSLDDTNEYKRILLDCLASASGIKEDSRRKIIESKELNIILYCLDDSHPKIILAASNLILSLSRAHVSIKKFLNEFDITSILFKLSSHSNVEIQIAITNSLCNFLLDSTSNMSEIIECISKLLKIISYTKHAKIRFNSICSIKNIMFYTTNLQNFKDIKKSIMKKITYDFILNLLDDEEVNVQEQALLIFRVLLYKTHEDIDEVFNNCKAKLLKKLEEKLKSTNNDVICQSLYVLCNISTGNEKQKSVVTEKCFLKKISEGLVKIYLFYFLGI